MSSDEYTLSCCLRQNDFDKFGRIKPSRVFEIFQDAAWLHAKQGGVGVEDLREKSLLWMVTKESFELKARLFPFEEIAVKTWFCKNPRLALYRGFSFIGADGQLAVIGNSQWVVANAETRRLEKVGRLYGDSVSRFDEVKMERIDCAECDTPCFNHTVRLEDIDLNGHANNTVYANLCVDACNMSFNVLQIDFHRELLLGDTVTVFAKNDGGRHFVKGERNGELIFSAIGE